MEIENSNALELRNYFDELSEKRISIRNRNIYYWNEITNYCSYFSHADNSILEVGCGTGDLIASIPGKYKVGIDFSPKMIEIATKRFQNISFFVLDAKNFNLDYKFDLIIFSNLIGFVDDVQEVFNNIKKISHNRTKIIITYYNHLWEPILKIGERIGMKQISPLQNWLSQSDIKNLLYLENFEVYRESKRMIIPYNIPIISTLTNNYIAKLPFFKLLCINNYTFARPVQNINQTNDNGNEFSVTIIIPVRNEGGNIENGLLRIPEFGKWQEIIYIEGNSTDDTWEQVKNVSEKYKNTHKIICAKQAGKGKNDAVKKGFSMASGDILMILDGDLTVPPEELPKFYNALAFSKGDFINGCRLVYPMEKQAMRTLNILGNKFFSLMFTWLLEQPLKDTLCGTKVLFRSDYEKMAENRAFFGDFDPFGDYDLLFGAYKLNLKIIEIPVHYKERTYGTTNISRFKHGLILLKMCLFAARKIKFR